MSPVSRVFFDAVRLHTFSLMTQDRIRCANTACEICDNSLWNALHPGEDPNVTLSVKSHNAKMAATMLRKRATAMDPVTDDTLHGSASGCTMMECGDPLFRFECDDGKIVWVHEVEVVEE